MVNDKFNPGCFSPDIRTRLEIAQQGRPEDLDRLVSDGFWPVRLAVARLKGMPLPKP